MTWAAHLLLRAFVNFLKGGTAFHTLHVYNLFRRSLGSTFTTCITTGISTWGKGAIDRALVTIWEAQALGASDENDKLGVTIVLVHTYLSHTDTQIPRDGHYIRQNYELETQIQRWDSWVHSTRIALVSGFSILAKSRMVVRYYVT